MDAQRLISRLDLRLDVAVGAEPESLEAPMITAIGPKHVFDADDGLALDLVAVPLLASRVEKSLGVGQRTALPTPAAGVQHRVGVREVRLIE